MRTILKLPETLRTRVLADLRRPHPVAFERVGFLLARSGALQERGVILVAYDYLAVDDGAYLPDPKVGARVTAEGFRPARQLALRETLSVIHVHLHEHRGVPEFGGTDARESRIFMEDFVKVRPDQPHAALILSVDSAAGRVWMRTAVAALPIDRVTFVGSVLTTVHHA